MASTTRTRTAPPRAAGRPAPGSARPPLWERARARFGGLGGGLPDVAGTPRLRRETFGLALVLVAVLTAAALGRGGGDGQLVAWWGDALTDSFGRAALLAPLLTALVALRALGGQPGPILEARHYLGGFLFAVAVVGLLQLGAGLARPEAGGYLGIAVATLSLRLLGQLGAGLALFVGGVFAVFLLAGTDLQTFWEDLRALGGLIWRGVRRVAGVIAALIRALPRPTPRPAAPRDEDAEPAAATAQTRPVRAPVRRAEPPRLILPDPPAARPAAALAVVEPALDLEPADEEEDDPAAAPEPEPEEPVIVAPARPAAASESGRRGRERERERERPTIRRATGEERGGGSPARPAATALPLPEVARLSHYDPVEPNADDLHAKARLIEETLASFRVEARVREINPGPAVTQFALEPGAGIKVRRITELQNDLALALAAPSVRIEAPIPGLARVGVEIPNEQIATVGLRETLESAAFARSKAKLPVPLGRDVNGRYVVGDLTRMPHLLIAGATGAGKSVCLNCIISTFLMTKAPDDLKLVMIDPKKVELTGYNGVPHLQCPVVTEMDKVVGALRLTLREMERRYALFARLGVRNLDGYRMKVADEPGAERLPYLVVIIDELADLMMTAPDEVETLLVRLAQMARATGIHLIIATQRPSVDVVTGLIKANVPSRIAFAVSSLTDSRVVLDMPGAERLLGRGDMLYLPADAAKPQRIQGAFLDDRDAQYVVDHWHSVAPVPQYAQEWLDLPSSSPATGGGGGGFDDDGGEDPLFEQALEVVKQQGTASASMLQRRLRVGYNRAARLIERMEDEGLIGPADGVRGRPVLVGDE